MPNTQNDEALAIDAAAKGNLKALKKFIDSGIDIQCKDNAIIYLSAKNGHLDCLKFAVESGGYIDAKRYCPWVGGSWRSS